MIVLDASVWISALSPTETRHDESLRWLFHGLSRDVRLVAPSSFLAEVAGAIARRTNDLILASETIEGIIAYPNLDLIDGDHAFWRYCAAVAAKLRLRGSDAAYVALADLFQVPLVTWDREQLTRGGLLIETRIPATDR